MNAVMFSKRHRWDWRVFYPNVAKVGGLQSQDAKGEAVVGYCKPLATPDLEPSGFPVATVLIVNTNL